MFHLKLLREIKEKNVLWQHRRGKRETVKGKERNKSNYSLRQDNSKWFIECFFKERNI